MATTAISYHSGSADDPGDAGDTRDPDGSTGPIARLATWRTWGLSAAVFVPFALMFFVSSAPFAIPEVTALCGQAPPDVRVSTTAAEVDGFLQACGPDGRLAYRNLQIADLLYPAVVGLFQASTLALSASRLGLRHRPVQALVALPVLAAAFDSAENAAAWAALVAFPHPAPTSGLLGLASVAKTGFSWSSGLAILAGLVILLARRLAGRRPTAGSAPGGGRMG